ncbi:MAG: sigma-70 family RNA polymerase sigma factor [bacterium]|nr:sigma-70 family RNA polymerase sigma factor [bacterium]
MSDSTRAAGAFRSTRWSIVLEAGTDRPGARAALEELCATYWYPLYAFARRTGEQRANARDLTQGFFALLLERGDLGTADPDRGRFRAFLVTAFRNYVSNERERARAWKRGGRTAPIAWDPKLEERYESSAAELSPERLFDRAWALELLDHVLAVLSDQYAASGKARVFESLKSTLTTEEPEATLTERGAAAGLSPGATKVAAHRLRSRYREALRAAIADTVGSEEQVDDELQALFQALGA